jgi:hypothetical protein
MQCSAVDSQSVSGIRVGGGYTEQAKSIFFDGVSPLLDIHKYKLTLGILDDSGFHSCCVSVHSFDGEHCIAWNGMAWAQFVVKFRVVTLLMMKKQV